MAFDREAVEAALRRIPARSAVGPDGVPAVLLRKCAKALSAPLQILWHASLQAGHVPEPLKDRIVTPVYKGAGKGDCANHRPVALTSHIIKTFERIVADQLVKHMEKNELLSKSQHGFRKGRSCASQLLQHQYTLSRTLESGKDIDVIYLDFSKAFDKVDQGMLLYKLRSMRVKDNLFRWLAWRRSMGGPTETTWHSTRRSSNCSNTELMMYKYKGCTLLLAAEKSRPPSR